MKFCIRNVRKIILQNMLALRIVLINKLTHGETKNISSKIDFFCVTFDEICNPNPYNSTSTNTNTRTSVRNGYYYNLALARKRRTQQLTFLSWSSVRSTALYYRTVECVIRQSWLFNRKK
jgi:hypothetical protein